MGISRALGGNSLGDLLKLTEADLSSEYWCAIATKRQTSPPTGKCSLTTEETQRLLAKGEFVENI